MAKYLIIVLRDIPRTGWRKGRKVLVDESKLDAFLKYRHYIRIVELKGKGEIEQEPVPNEDVEKLAALKGISETGAQKIVDAGYTYESFLEALKNNDERAWKFVPPMWRSTIKEELGIVDEGVTDEQDAESDVENNEEASE